MITDKKLWRHYDKLELLHPAVKWYMYWGNSLYKSIFCGYQGLYVKLVGHKTWKRKEYSLGIYLPAELYNYWLLRRAANLISNDIADAIKDKREMG